MSPTCSNRDLAGRNALSATDLTIALLRSRPPPWGAAPRAVRTGDAQEDYGMESPFATHNRRVTASNTTSCSPTATRKSPEVPAQSAKEGGTVRAMLRPPLEESARTARPLRVRVGLGIRLLVALSAVGVSACGGGQRQDATEPEGNFPVQIVSADFPSRQELAQNTNLTLAVANSGDQTIPNLAITIFTTSSAGTGGSTTTTPAS